MLCGRQRKVQDGLYFVSHRMDSLAVHMESKEVEVSCAQDTFARVDLEAMVLKTGENLAEMIPVFL